MYGSTIFHFGALAAIGGHVVGILMRMDLAVFALLAVVIVTGMLGTLTSNLGAEIHYRETVAPHFRSLFALDPRPELMTGGEVTFIFQAHVIGAWFLYAAWPFSRLVHAWSIPVDWFRRSPIPYRGRVAAARTTR